MANGVRIIGLTSFSKKLKDIATKTPREVKKEMVKIIVAMDRDIKKTISSGSRSGKTYGKRRHRASARGEAPKTDRGGLVAGFLFDIKGGKNIVGRIRNISRHAAPLEFKPATRGGRPFMRPLYKRWEKRVIVRLGAKVRNTVIKVAKK